MVMIAAIGVVLWGVASWERAHRRTHLTTADLGIRIEFDRRLADFVWEPTEDQLLGRAYRIKLIGTQASDGDLERLCSLANPSTLFLASTSITDRGLVHLERMTNISYLDLQDTQISDACIDSLLRLPNLQGLAINDTRMTHDGIKRLKQALPSLIIHNY
jgi:hypothetical protein